MSTRLKEYIGKRLKDPKAVSSVECDLLATVDRYHLSGTVKILYIDHDRFELYSAEINSKVAPVRITISHEISEGPHGLNAVLNIAPEVRRQRDSLFSYDPSDGRLIFDDYFKQYCDLEKVFDEVMAFLAIAGIKPEDRVIIGGTVFADKVLLYCLERRAGSVMLSAYSGEEVSTLRRIEIDSKVSQMKTGVAYPMNTVLGLILNKKDVYVPLDGSVLDSEFCKHWSWRRLLGSMTEESEKDVVINGIKCRLVRLTPYVDGFGNVFFDLWSPLDGMVRHTLVAGPGYERKFDSESPSHEECRSESVAEPQVQSQESPQEAPCEQSPIEEEAKPVCQPRDISCPRHSAAPERTRNKKEDSAVKETEEKKASKRDNKKPEKYRYNSLMASDTIVLFDGSVFQWKKKNEKIPSMSRKELDETLGVINGVFETLLKSQRIVTDTNLWVAELPSKPGEMAYRKLIEHILDKNKQLVYELIGEVYDEIYKLDQQKTAAANSAKNFINTQLRLGRVEILNVRLGADRKAYADEKIGHRVLQLYEDGVNFSILTNDTDASTRWLAGLRQKQRELNRQTLPPMLLCRELLTLFRMRGKLIAQRRQLDSNKQ